MLGIQTVFKSACCGITHPEHWSKRCVLLKLDCLKLPLAHAELPTTSYTQNTMQLAGIPMSEGARRNKQTKKYMKTKALSTY